MAFQNYKTTDYAQTTLLWSITSWATSLQVESWDGALFPSSWDFFLTLEAFTLNEHETETITKREQVKVTARSSDTMTIVRWVNWTTAQAFSAWDRVSLYLVAENIQDINTEVARLENDKLDNNELRTWLGASKILTTNGSWAETELAFSWDVTQTLLGNWTRGASQVNINWQTAETWALATWDEIIFYDASAWANRKRPLKASETNEWVVEKATDTEAATWTDTSRYVTPKQVKDNYSFWMKIITFTFNESTVTWTVAYSHWLGRVPKHAQLVICNTSTSPRIMSQWFWDGSNQYALTNQQSSGFQSVLQSGKILTTQHGTADSAYVTWVLQDPTSTDIDIAYTKTWSPASEVWTGILVLWW